VRWTSVARKGFWRDSSEGDGADGGDTRILEDEIALEACLEKIRQESERVAWNALEQGTEALREGLAILEGAETLGDGGYVN
jgi:hypothetical protein